MEKVTLIYEFNDENNLKRVEAMKNDKEDSGLHDYEVCEMFMDFMRSVGFSEQNVIDYFRE